MFAQAVLFAAAASVVLGNFESNMYMDGLLRELREEVSIRVS